MSHPLKRPALGQKAKIGTFYNAHTDTFQPSNLFVSDLPAGAVKTSLHQRNSAGLSQDDSRKGRFDLLGIGPDLGASLLAGLASVGGSARCLGERVQVLNATANDDRGYAAISHQLTTAEDALQLAHPELRDQVQDTQVGDFTHVVTEIEWGCQTAIVARCVFGRDGNAQDTFGRAINAFKHALEELHYMPNPDTRAIQVNAAAWDIVAYSEIFQEDGVVMEDLEEAFDFIKLLPSLLKHSGRNSGQGEPIAYTLLPIRTVVSILNLQATSLASSLDHDVNMMPLTADFLNVVLMRFDDLTRVKSSLASYATLLTRSRAYVPMQHVEECRNAVSSFDTEVVNLKRKYGRLLQQARTSMPDASAMDDLLKSLDRLQKRLDRILASGPQHQAKVKLVGDAVDRGAVYIGYNKHSLGSLLDDSYRRQKDTYVLKFTEATVADDPAKWTSHQVLLDELLLGASSQGAVVAIMDCDATGQVLDSVQMAYFDQDGNEVTQDLQAQRQFEADQSFARYDPTSLERADDKMQKPVQRRMVKIPCPGADCNNLQVCQWICEECHAQLEFGFTDDYLYCDCGRAKFNKWRFKCNSSAHGNRTNGGFHSSKRSAGDFVPYSNEAQLLSILKSLGQDDYVNILILGETGVGKSTFINSFVNYLSFDTLEEAKRAEELNWVIPCSFSLNSTDRSRPNGAIVQRKVQVGMRDDEADGSKGGSATQQTAVYPVNIGTKTVRLIDTPGIGDTRGLAFDKQNMADILRTLSGYEQLHGILILLKSNNSRLTTTFNFCMQELLVHLHRSASQNIAFGFTNARISNYSPGDTFGPLSSLLDRHKDVGLALENQNTYCFDSESFRFLAAFKQGIEMENEDDFRRSWDHSCQEARRVVEFFETRTPHAVKSTMSLNGTRQLIAELTKPMTDITQLINTNIKLCKDRMGELSDIKLSGDALRNRLQVSKILVRPIKLDKPRTVCRHEDCCEWRDDGTGATVPVYKEFCHDPCYLDNIPVDKMNYPELLNCYAFGCGSSNTCQRSSCGHSWQQHLHVIHELEEYSTMVTDTQAQLLFQQNENATTVKQQAIKDLEQRVEEYKDEHAQIQQAAARFGIFLQKHSITPYNDATLEYLDILIQEEEQKARVSRDPKKLQMLQNDRANHIELVKALSRSMDEGKKSLVAGAESDEKDIAAVEAEVRKLYGLHHFGDTLRDVKNGVTAAHQATYRERPFKISHKKHHTGRSRKPSGSPGRNSHHAHAHAHSRQSSNSTGYGSTLGPPVNMSSRPNAGSSWSSSSLVPGAFPSVPSEPPGSRNSQLIQGGSQAAWNDAGQQGGSDDLPSFRPVNGRRNSRQQPSSSTSGALVTGLKGLFGVR